MHIFMQLVGIIHWIYLLRASTTSRSVFANSILSICWSQCAVESSILLLYYIRNPSFFFLNLLSSTLDYLRMLLHFYFNIDDWLTNIYLSKPLENINHSLYEIWLKLISFVGMTNQGQINEQTSNVPCVCNWTLYV